MHRHIGMSDDESLEEWRGMDMKKPIDCPQCLERLKELQKESSIKYGWKV